MIHFVIIQFLRCKIVCFKLVRNSKIYLTNNLFINSFMLVVLIFPECSFIDIFKNAHSNNRSKMLLARFFKVKTMSKMSIV